MLISTPYIRALSKCYKVKITLTKLIFPFILIYYLVKMAIWHIIQSKKIKNFMNRHY
jgi:hypothetical protein